MTYYSGQLGSCYWTCLVGKVREVDLDDFVGGLDRIGKSELSRFTVIDFVHGINLPNSMQRKRITDAMETQPGRERAAGHAIVSDSTVARGVVTAVNWFVPPVFPERIFSSPRPALEWLRELDPDLEPTRLLAGVTAAVPGFSSLSWPGR